VRVLQREENLVTRFSLRSSQMVVLPEMDDAALKEFRPYVSHAGVHLVSLVRGLTEALETKLSDNDWFRVMGSKDPPTPPNFKPLPRLFLKTYVQERYGKTADNEAAAPSIHRKKAGTCRKKGHTRSSSTVFRFQEVISIRCIVQASGRVDRHSEIQRDQTRKVEHTVREDTQRVQKYFLFYGFFM
jgi:hypothetical protein